MTLIVQKFGGSSVGDLERIRRVARRVVKTQSAGHQVVVVVPAMAGEASRLRGLASAFGPRPEEREQDVVVAAGGLIAAGLTAMAVQAEGGRARSFTGSQARILTEADRTGARICSVDDRGLRRSLERGEIPVLAGVQGEDEQGNVTALGPGGADAAAVAVAAALGAEACEIYGEAGGVHTADPAVCPAARRMERVTYEEMLELAGAGARVPPFRAVELAMKNRVPLWVKSDADDGPGTLCGPEDTGMEQVVVRGIASDRNEAKVALRDVNDRPGIAARVFTPLAEAGIVVDLIVQSVSRDGRTDLTFTVKKSDLAAAKDIIEKVLKEIGAEKIETDDEICKVSIVGAGMRNHAGVAAKAFQAMSRAGINIELISASEIKVSMVMKAKYMELAVRELHTAFGLDARPGG